MIRSYISLTEQSVALLWRSCRVLLLVAAMLVVCEMIFRALFLARRRRSGRPISSSIAPTAAIFLGAPYVLLKRAHVGVDVIEHLLTGDALRRAAFAGQAVSAGLLRDHAGRQRLIKF